MVLVEDLARTQIATEMTKAQLEVLCNRLELVEYKDGDTVVDASAEDRDLYVLVKGNAKVVGAFGVEVQVIATGSLIGELSFLDKRPRSASVISDGSSVVAKITGRTMTDLERDHPDIVAKMLRNISLLLCARLRSATRMIDALNISI